MSRSERRIEDAGIPSKTELAQRIARVEEGLDHIDDKLDHQSDQLERIANSLDEQMDENAHSIETIEEQHQRLWLTYQGTKWLLALSGGGAVTVFFLSTLFGL